MYDDLLKELECIKDKNINVEVVDNIFEKYYWDCMGFSESKKKPLRLIYIESPKWKEINLEIETNDYENIKINNIIKKYWDS